MNFETLLTLEPEFFIKYNLRQINIRLTENRKIFLKKIKN